MPAPKRSLNPETRARIIIAALEFATALFNYLIALANHMGP